ncbi:alpha-(1,3)-fucosyltransferase C-like [Tigriopus californicus]|nr:alpha-(1,3)-fucosyltransferase C-like [Tigriopus californicus]
MNTRINLLITGVAHKKRLFLIILTLVLFSWTYFSVIKKRNFPTLSNSQLLDIKSMIQDMCQDVVSRNPKQLANSNTSQPSVSINVMTGNEVPFDQLKKILFYTDCYGGWDYFIGATGREAFRVLGCPDAPCYVTSNRSLMPLDQFDALVFHPRANSFAMANMPKIRSPHQRYIMWIIESGCYPSHALPKFDNFFNWTMSYRLDSDILQPYGTFKEIRPLPQKAALDSYIAQFGRDHTFFAKNKTKLAAWFVSNCNTAVNREGYVEELKKYISVDIYGRCGHLKCQQKQPDNCLNIVDNDYKFYLAFENSLSLDYVTEKMFKVMDKNVIPVTLASNQRLPLPKHSIIDATKFSPQDLASYLKEIDANDALYAEYHWWKSFYRIEKGNKVNNFCQLCQKLNDPRDPPKTYQSMQKWWVNDANCSKWSQNRIIKASPWPMSNG